MLLAEIVARSEKVIVSWSDPFPEVAGRLLDDVAREWGVRGSRRRWAVSQPAGGIYFMMDEEDLARILAFPGAMIGSDGLPHDVFPHPRLWGTFPPPPRVLGRYARDEGLIGLEDAVHRMTGKPAAVFGLPGRGELREGAYADLVVFDPEAITDTATFEDPARARRQGVRAVFVNGREVWAEGAAVPSRGGRARTPPSPGEPRGSAGLTGRRTPPRRAGRRPRRGSVRPGVVRIGTGPLDRAAPDHPVGQPAGRAAGHSFARAPVRRPCGSPARWPRAPWRGP